MPLRRFAKFGKDYYDALVSADRSLGDRIAGSKCGCKRLMEFGRGINLFFKGVVERVLDSLLRVVPVWVVSPNGFLPHDIEAGLIAIATVQFQGIFRRWQLMFDHLKLNRNGAVNVILADGNEGDPDVFRWVEMVRDAVASTAIIALLGESDDDAISSAFQVGASGYLAPPFSVDQLASAILTAASGGIVISPVLLSKVIRIGAGADQSCQIHSLTRRELDILRLLVEGNSVREMADSLSISYFTADTHLKNLHRKLGVKNSRSLVSIALQNNLI